MQHAHKPNVNTPIPKPHQQFPLNYKAAVEQSKPEQPNSFSHLSGAKELPYTNQHVATGSHQEHEINSSERYMKVATVKIRNTVTVNIGSPKRQFP